jgi:hypothetical protein
MVKYGIKMTRYEVIKYSLDFLIDNPKSSFVDLLVNISEVAECLKEEELMQDNMIDPEGDDPFDSVLFWEDD